MGVQITGKSKRRVSVRRRRFKRGRSQRIKRGQEEEGLGFLSEGGDELGKEKNRGRWYEGFSTLGKKTEANEKGQKTGLERP